MNYEVFYQGIQQFAENADAQLSKESDTVFHLTFPDERYPAIIGIAGFGLALTFAIYCGVVPNTSLAPTFLQKNWGSVEGTGFYFSVSLLEGQPWLFLETLQYIDPDATPEEISSTLANCHLQGRQAKESLG